jgi:hypothetical protein
MHLGLYHQNVKTMGLKEAFHFVARAAVAPQVPSSIYTKHYINRIGIGVDYS